MNTWQKVKIISSEIIGPDVKSVVVSIQNPKFKPGQYFDIRLKGGVSYRNYSIAGSKKNTIEFGIQLLPGGEISPSLFALKPGDFLEIRGPIGNHFTWENKIQGDLILIGGGSGVVPLISMIRHSHGKILNRHVFMLISAKTIDSILYKNEIDAFALQNKNFQISYIFTKKRSSQQKDSAKRIDKNFLLELLLNHAQHIPTMYIAGPTSFVETVVKYLLQIGFNPSQIRTERFGD